jgi:dienelactone hydrolase
MRTAVIAFAAALALHAQIPATDSRNTNLPDTGTHFTPRRYATLAEWEARKNVLRKQILSAAGLLPMFPKTVLHPQVFGRIQQRDYTIEKVLLETLPGVYLGGNLYRPTKPVPAGGFPGVVSPHGHWNYGRLEHTNIASIPARCITLARQGYVVFAYDMLGYNDTIQTPHDFGDAPRDQLWDFNSLGLQLWNSIRAVDFLQSLPDVNPNRIGATGASGGATQVFLLAAVDDRVQFDAPANMVSLIYQGGGVCENGPNLRIGTNNVEFAAMMAPKPMLMAGSTGDWTRNTMSEEYPAVRAIYDLYGKPDNIQAFFQDAPHNYNQASREAMYAFFGKHVLGESGVTKKEGSVHLEKLQDMLVLHNRTLPAGALTFDRIRELWVRLSKEQTGDERERLSLALAAEWPSHVLSQTEGDRIVLSREGQGDRIPGIWIKGANPPALVVHPDGAEAARKTPEVARLMQSGRAILMIDAFQTGTAVAARDRSARMFLTFNKSDDANRVQDILTALAWLHKPKTELTGTGKAAVWALFAAAISPEPVELHADVSKFTGSDDDFLSNFFVPGIQRAGGLKAASSLAHQR